MAKSNNDTRKQGKERDAHKEKVAKPTVKTADNNSGDSKLRNSKTHFHSPYAY